MTLDKNRSTPTPITSSRACAVTDFEAALEALGTSAPYALSTTLHVADEPELPSRGLLHHVQVFDNLVHWNDAALVSDREAADTMETLTYAFRLLGSKGNLVLRGLVAIRAIETRETDRGTQLRMELGYAGRSGATQVSYSLGELRKMMLEAGLVPAR